MTQNGARAVLLPLLAMQGFGMSAKLLGKQLQLVYALFKSAWNSSMPIVQVCKCWLSSVQDVSSVCPAPAFHLIQHFGFSLLGWHL